MRISYTWCASAQPTHNVHIVSAQLQLSIHHEQSFASEPLLDLKTVSQATELPCGSGHQETYRDGMTPGTTSPHDQDSSRPNSGRSSTGSGRHHADILPGTANAHSSSGNHNDGAARSGDSYM